MTTGKHATMLITVTIAAFILVCILCGCRYCIITGNNGNMAFSTEQGKTITPKTSLTGVPGL